jgi:hypothetical protein
VAQSSQPALGFGRHVTRRPLPLAALPAALRLLHLRLLHLRLLQLRLSQLRLLHLRLLHLRLGAARQPVVVHRAQQQSRRRVATAVGHVVPRREVRGQSL